MPAYFVRLYDYLPAAGNQSHAALYQGEAARVLDSWGVEQPVDFAPVDGAAETGTPVANTEALTFHNMSGSSRHVRTVGLLERAHDAYPLATMPWCRPGEVLQGGSQMPVRAGALRFVLPADAELPT